MPVGFKVFAVIRITIYKGPERHTIESHIDIDKNNREFFGVAPTVRGITMVFTFAHLV